MKKKALTTQKSHRMMYKAFVPAIPDRECPDETEALRRANNRHKSGMKKSLCNDLKFNSTLQQDNGKSI